MAKSNTVWGIDIGQCAMKALKLTEVEGELQVTALDIVEHPTVLSQSEGNQKELIQNALSTFLARNKIGGATIAISVPGFRSLASFVKLPPVEPKRVPDIVRFEAEQQIPFPIEQVIWRWQTFHDPDSPDVEVGIFAIKRADVDETLEYFSQVDLNVDLVQMSPLALYNFMCFDQQISSDGATLLMDVGADKTDLVVADGAKLWTRTIQIGGSNFTEALVKAFKLSFQKAEQLKRTAATSKYARQVFQSMRPVFSDLVQEVQRSIGYYTSLHRETQFKRLVGLGNGFRLPGLQRFLEQNLNMPVARIDAYNQVKPSEAVSAATLSENVLSLAVAYGTAVEALGKGRIQTNLLPVEIVRRRLWDRKRWWFVAAAAVLIAALTGPLFRARADRKVLDDSATFSRAISVYDGMDKLRRQYDKLQSQGQQETEQIQSYVKLFAYRDFVPAAQTLISKAIQAVFTDQPKLVAYPKDMELIIQAQERLDQAKDDEAKKQIQAEIAKIQKRLKSFTDIPRNERRVVIIKTLHMKYVGSELDRSKVADKKPAKKPKKSKKDREPALRKEDRRFVVTIVARSPRPKQHVNDMINRMRQECHALKSSRISDVNEIRDWRALIAKLKQPGKGAAAPLVKRIWELLGAGLRQEIRAVPQGEEPGIATKRGILNQLNSLLARKDLWRPSDLERVNLGSWEKGFRRKLEEGTAKTNEVAHLNRAGLQTAFPKALGEWYAKELRSVGFHKLVRTFALAGKRERGARAPDRADAAAPSMPDPTFAGEDMSADTRFQVTVTLYVQDEGLDVNLDNPG